MSNQVIVYSTKGCTECTLVKEMLTKEGIPFEVRDVLKNPEYQPEVEKFGFMGVPVTVVAGQAVKGFNPDELMNLLEVTKDS
ncbi:glutaredoxin family protein [Bacillus sp. FJAT-29790]|uniref:glutaredoxin family protein n=1 Tax=Bacillus sp. FJAT-29790 TaxID=1895002 RepID=UPI001C24F1DD|nr:glutaredoxin family protein [Bacillus sp. FJAT-29790]MBU8881219.1 glutaredoxin family protein [Bacillus sp. FJAT-29790]